jgi:hypothetical protein
VKLFDLWVELGVKGFGAVSDAFKQVKTQLEAVQKGAEAVGKVATVAFASASATLAGFVRAGLAGTTAGEALSLRFQMLSREIASLFLPAIRATIGAVGSLVTWFRTLSGDQQASIARWTAAGLAALGVATILPRVAAGIGLVTGALRALAGSLGGPLALFLGLAAGTVAFGGLAGWDKLGASIIRAVAPIREGLAAAFEKALPKLQAVAGELAAAFVPLVEAAGKALVKMLPAVLEVGGAVASLLVPAMKALAAVLNAVGDWLPVIVKGFAALQGAKLLVGVFGAVTTAAQGLYATLGLIVANPIVAGFALLAAAIGLVVYNLARARAESEALFKRMNEYEGKLTRKAFLADPFVANVLGEKDPEKRRRRAAAELEAAQRDQIEVAKRLRSASGVADLIDKGFTGDSRTERLKREAAAADERVTRARKLYEEVVQGKPFAGAPEEPGKLRGRPRDQLASSQTGFEAFQRTYERLQEAALKTSLGPDIPTLQLTQLGLIKQAIDDLAMEVKLKKPGTV